MRRLLAMTFLLVALAPAARAHFIFLVPPQKEGGTPHMVFSDSTAADDGALLKKIAQTKVWSCSAKGTIAPVKFSQADDVLNLDIDSKEACVLFATCTYGVFKRNDQAGLLHYYAKTCVGSPKDMTKCMGVVNEKLDLDITTGDAHGSMKVTWKGKPLAKTKVFVAVGKDRSEETTDEKGAFAVDKAKLGAGLVTFRVGHTVDAGGEYKGEKYAVTKHWATLVIDTRLFKVKAVEKVEPTSTKEEAKESAEATKLLADARAARANWEGFPGFSADVEVNLEGKVTKGKVDVDHKGKVVLHGFESKDLEASIRRQLSSIVGHRMSDSGDQKTPCAFPDDDAHHPLGRSIQVLNDEFHSSYRIRDRQVIVVNRSMKDIRFTITVLENKVNEEKQFLPAHYVVNSWDVKSGALKRSETFRHEWVRVGKFDLPTTSMMVTASDGKLEAKKMTLSNHKLK